MSDIAETIKSMHKALFGTNVAETSIKCYHELLKEGKINKQQNQILGSMKRNRDYSLQELCIESNLPVNVVSGRVNELKEKGYIITLYKRPCSITRRTIQALELNPRYL